MQLKNLHWRLWIALCSLALIPAVYQTIRTFLISAGNQNEVFNIIGQMEWFGLINETLQAFLIVPLYSVLNKIFKKQPDRFAGAVFQTGLLVFVLYTVFSTGVFLHGKTLMQAMNADGLDPSAVSRYLNLETAAFIIGTVASFVQVVFVVAEKHRNVYIFLAVRTLLSLIADFFLIPYWGVYGAAVSNILVSTVLAVTGLALLQMQKHIRICRFKNTDFAILKAWCRTGAFSGLRQFVDNLIYAVMICEMVNRRPLSTARRALGNPDIILRHFDIVKTLENWYSDFQSEHRPPAHKMCRVLTISAKSPWKPYDSRGSFFDYSV